MIIGITGTDGAGKGTVVEYLVHKGFKHYSARDLWVEAIKKEGLEVNRANMRLTANRLRKEQGNDYLVTAYLKQIQEEGVTDAIIESIRAIAEVDTLKKAGAILLAVDADQKVRYDRIQLRASESDQVSFDEFVKHEALEMNDPDPNGMQKAKVIASADIVVFNNGTPEELFAQVEAALASIHTK